MVQIHLKLLYGSLTEASNACKLKSTIKEEEPNESLERIIIEEEEQQIRRQ